MFTWTQIFAIEQHKKFAAHFESKEKSVLAKFMVLCAGRKQAEDYKFDHRKFIADRYQALGLKPKDFN
jgi:hypothetical protein